MCGRRNFFVPRNLSLNYSRAHLCSGGLQECLRGSPQGSDLFSTPRPRGSFHLGWGVLYFADKEEMAPGGGWSNYIVSVTLWVLSANFNNAAKGAFLTLWTRGPKVERALGLELGDAC